MPQVTLISIIAAIIVMGGGIGVALWLRKRERVRKQARVQQNKWIVEALQSINTEADRKRLHIHAAQKVDVADTFVHLRDLTEGYSEDLKGKINNIEKLWKQLNSQLAEYADHPASSTLQTSIIAVKTSKLANEIGKLSREIEITIDRA